MSERRYRAGDQPVPSFTLVRYIGSGNFGEVWEARAPGNVRAALKILYGIDRKAGRKAFSALQLVKNLRNPHLVPIMGFWLKDEKGEILDDEVDPNFSEDSTISGIAPGLGDGEDIGKTLRPGQATPLESSVGDDDLLKTTPGTLDRPAELIIAMGLADETLDDCLARYKKESEAAKVSRSGKGSGKELVGIPRDELLYYLEGAAKGLDFLNFENAIQHGDVKPQNIMVVSGEGQVSDFDLARAMENIQATTTKVGTPAYMAPEVFEDGVPSDKTDQYSLAITYYEMRTGRLPYRDLKYSIVVRDKLLGNLDFSLLPKAERTVIQKAAALQPAARFATCCEMVAALRPRDPDPVRKLLMCMAMVLGLVIITGLVWQWSAPDGKRPLDWILGKTDDTRNELKSQLEEQVHKSKEGDVPLDFVYVKGILETLLLDPRDDEHDLLMDANRQMMEDGLNLLRRGLFPIVGESYQNKTQKDLFDVIGGHLRDLDASKESQSWLCNEQDRQCWRWRLALACLRMAQLSEVDFPDKSLLVESEDRVLSDVSSEAWFTKIDPAEQVAATALTALIRLEKSQVGADSQPTPLKSWAVKPLARLMGTQSWDEQLTTNEKKRIAESRVAIEAAVLELTKAVGSVGKIDIPDDVADDLEAITAVDVSTLVDLGRAFDSIQDSKWGVAHETLATISDQRTENTGDGHAGTKQVTQFNSTIPNRLEELNLLLLLREFNAAKDLPPKAPDPVTSDVDARLYGLLTSTGSSPLHYVSLGTFCDAMVNSCQKAILYHPLHQVVSIAGVEKIIRHDEVERQLGKTVASDYLRWCDWIRAVDGVCSSQPDSTTTYAEWELQCAPFPPGSIIADGVSPALSAIVGLARIECLAVANLRDDRFRLSADQRSRFRDDLHHLRGLQGDQPKRFEAYLTMCEAFMAYTDAVGPLSAPPDNSSIQSKSAMLLESTKIFVQALFQSQQNQDARKLLVVRPDRVRLCRRIVLRAVSAEETSAESFPADRLFAQNPFREGGADAAYAFLTTCFKEQWLVSLDAPKDADLGTDTPRLSGISDEDIGYLAAAAAFCSTPIAEEAAIYADEILTRIDNKRVSESSSVNNAIAEGQSELAWQSEQNLQLISAWAHSQIAILFNADAAKREEHEIKALRRIADIARKHHKLESDEKYGIDVADNYYGVLKKGIELVEATRLKNWLAEAISAESAKDDDEAGSDAVGASGGVASALPPVNVDRKVAEDAAAVFHAVAISMDSLEIEKRDKELAHKEQYTRSAHLLDLPNISYLSHDVILRLGKLPNSQAQMRILKQAADALKAIDENRPEYQVFEAMASFRSARSATNEQDLRTSLEIASKHLDAYAKSAFGSKEIEVELQAFHLLTRANVRFELANVVDPASNRDETIGGLLDGAIADCGSLEKMHVDHPVDVPEGFLVEAYTTWGNACEDQELLINRSQKGDYEHAIAKFHEAYARAYAMGGKEQSLALLQFNIARCQYRLHLAGRKYVPVNLRDVNIAMPEPDDPVPGLSIAESMFQDLCNSDTEAHKLQHAESHVYLARIKRRRARMEANSATGNREKVREFLADSNRQFMIVVETYADPGKMVERFLWKLEWARMLTEAFALDQDDKWKAKACDLVRELLSSDRGVRSAEPAGKLLSRESARFLLTAVVTVIMECVTDAGERSPFIVSAAAAISYDDLKADLYLRHAQLKCDYLDRVPPNMQKQFLGQIEQDLADANRCVVELGKGGTDVTDVGTWNARVAGQRALVAERRFAISTRAITETNKTDVAQEGLAAFNGLLAAIKNAETAKPRVSELELVFPRYRLGEIARTLTEKPLLRTTLDADPAFKPTIQEAKVQVREIRKDAWEQRAKDMCKTTELLDRWTWGRQEKDVLTSEKPRAGESIVGREPNEYRKVIDLLNGLQLSAPQKTQGPAGKKANPAGTKS